MADEKIVYEVALTGISGVMTQLQALQAALSSLTAKGLVSVNKELSKIPHTLVKIQNEYSKTKVFRTSHDDKYKEWLNSRGLGFLANTPWAADRTRSAFGQTRPAITTIYGKESTKGFSRFHSQTVWDNHIKRLKIREHKLGWRESHRPLSPRELLQSTFPNIPQLTYQGFTMGESSQDLGWGLDDRDRQATLWRTKRREDRYAKWQQGGQSNRWSSNWGIVPYQEHGVVPYKDYIDAEYTDLNDPKPNGNFNRGGKPDFFSSFLFKTASKFPKVTSAFIALGKIGLLARAFWFAFRPYKEAMEKLVRAVNVIAKDAEQQHRETRNFGISAGSWQRIRNQSTFLGDDAASASALISSLAADRVMLRYGGDGGKSMEAARLFGLSLAGSKRGFATEEEMLRNINRRMQSLDSDSQHALAMVLGLNAFQEHAVRASSSEYDRISSKRTYRQALQSAVFGTDPGLASGFAEYASHDFFTAFGELSNAFNETLYILGEAVLPLLSTLATILTSVLELLNVFLEPIAKIIGLVFIAVRKILEFLGLDIDSVSRDVAGSNALMGRTTYYNDPENQYGGRRVVVNIDSINMGTLGFDENMSKEQVASELTKMFIQALSNKDGGRRS